MKKTVFLTPHQLSEAFETAKKEYQSYWEEIGFLTLVESLSKAVKDLQNIGLDVHLLLSPAIHEDAFKLVREIDKITGSFSISCSGILTIGQDDHLIAISTEKDRKNVLGLYISRRNFFSQTIHNDHRCDYFDLENDVEAMIKFQRFIIKRYARNEVLRAHDVENAFGTREQNIRRLQNKPVLKPRPL